MKELTLGDIQRVNGGDTFSVASAGLGGFGTGFSAGALAGSVAGPFGALTGGLIGGMLGTVGGTYAYFKMR